MKTCRWCFDNVLTNRFELNRRWEHLTAYFIKLHIWIGLYQAKQTQYFSILMNECTYNGHWVKSALTFMAFLNFFYKDFKIVRYIIKKFLSLTSREFFLILFFPEQCWPISSYFLFLQAVHYYTEYWLELKYTIGIIFCIFYSTWPNSKGHVFLWVNWFH